jgi:hypothetical protein
LHPTWLKFWGLGAFLLSSFFLIQNFIGSCSNRITLIWHQNPDSACSIAGNSAQTAFFQHFLLISASSFTFSHFKTSVVELKKKLWGKSICLIQLECKNNKCPDE